MTRINVLLSILAVVLVVCCALLPAPAPLTEQEKGKIAQEISDKIEWNGYGDTVTGKLPIIEIPKNDPFFRLVRVSTFGARNGYHFNEEYVGFDFGRPRIIDVGKFIRER